MTDHSVKLAELLSLWASYTTLGSISWKYQAFREEADRVSATIKDNFVMIDRIKLQSGEPKFTLNIRDKNGVNIITVPIFETSISDAEIIFKEAGAQYFNKNDRVIEKTLDELLSV